MKNRNPIIALIIVVAVAALFFVGKRAHWFDGLEPILHPDPAQIERESYVRQAERDRAAAFARGDAKEAARQEELIKEYSRPKVVE
jgi:hypothetical protein